MDHSGHSRGCHNYTGLTLDNLISLDRRLFTTLIAEKDCDNGRVTRGRSHCGRGPIGAYVGQFDEPYRRQDTNRGQKRDKGVNYMVCEYLRTPY
jgi:hypothetical protein